MNRQSRFNAGYRMLGATFWIEDVCAYVSVCACARERGRKNDLIAIL